MKHVSVLVYKNMMLTAFSSIVSLLDSANEARNRVNKPPAFEVETVSTKRKHVVLAMGLEIFCNQTINENFETDIIIIPPMHTGGSNLDQILSDNHKLVLWLKERYKVKAQIMSLCTGAYFLAETGLLNGSTATSHSGAIEDLERRYPLIQFEPGEIITTSKAIITAGGGFSALSAVLYLIERNCGKPLAIELSKHFALDYGRYSQALFETFSGRRQHSDDQIHKAQTFIGKRFRGDISVDQVARYVNMSKRNFIRRFKSATNMSPLEFIQKLKVEAARKALESGKGNIADITYSVGYNDLKTFRSIFKRTTGLTPIEYRSKFNASSFGRLQ